MVNRVINPVRTLRFSNGPAGVKSPENSTYAYYTGYVCTPSDYQRMFSNLTDAFISLTSGGTAEPWIQTKPDDLKLMMESADMNLKFSNTFTIPVVVTAYWLRPRFDLYTGEQSPSIDNLLAIGYSNVVNHDSIPIQYTDLNFDIYTSEVCKYWKIFKRKTVVVGPGIACDFSAVVKRKYMTYRRCFLQASTVDIPTYFRHTQALLLQVSAQTMGVLTADGTTPLMPRVFCAVEPEETYKFRALVDTRPTVTYGPSLLARGTAGSEAINTREQTIFNPTGFNIP